MTPTAAQVFSLLSPDDRSEVAARCFREGRFDESGEIVCQCDDLPFLRRRPAWLTQCGEEYLCEVFAAYLLIPDGTMYWPSPLPTARLAEVFEVDEWVIRLRRALDGLGRPN